MKVWIFAIQPACHIQYVRGVDKDFNISEELAAMQSMKGRTTGKDICIELIV